MNPADLQQPVVLSVLGTGFGTAFLHAALPTHWLPFVLVGRAQEWSLLRVLGAVAVAGVAHICTTALAGGLIVALGLVMEQWIAGLLPGLSAALLFAFGAFYLGRSLLRQPAVGAGAPLAISEPTVSHTAAFWGLVAMMAISPGEVLLPIYLSQATQGALTLGVLTVSFAAGTVLGMALLTVLARAGWSVLRLERWARYEGAVLGLALILLALLVVSRPH